jgi:hypothetical protein
MIYVKESHGEPREADGWLFDTHPMLTIVIYKRRTSESYAHLSTRTPTRKVETEVVMPIAWLENNTKLPGADSERLCADVRQRHAALHFSLADERQLSSSHLHYRQTLIRRRS